MSANNCGGCENSRRHQRSCFEKFTYCLKYIFCCGCCYDSCRKCRRKRPRKITRRVRQIKYIKNKPNRSRHKINDTESANSNDLKVYYCNISSNSNSLKSTHLFERTNSKRQCGKISEDEPVEETNQSRNQIKKKQTFTKNKNKESDKTESKRLCYISPYCKKQQAPLKKIYMQEKAKFKYNPLSSIFLCCVGMNEKKGVASRDAKSRISPQSKTFADNASCSKDFGSQYSLKSNQSLEIFSHALTSSTSQLSSVESIISLKWKRRFQRQPKKPSVLQLLFRDLSNKIKSKKSKRSRDVYVNNVLVLGVPKYYKHKLSQPSDKVNKPLLIRDSIESTIFKMDVCTTPSNKICGPGEVSAILKLKESGKVRHVGVSNVNEEQLIRLCSVEKPACLQVEVHILFQQKPLIAAATRLGIPVVAYSPLGSKGLVAMISATTGRNYPDLLELPLVQNIAKTHSRTTAQILLRFLLQHGVGAIPKSTNPSRIRQNISVWDFELSKKEMEDLIALDRGEEGRICDFGFFIGTEKHSEFPFKKS